jgi:hypothetical protein
VGFLFYVAPSGKAVVFAGRTGRELHEFAGHVDSRLPNWTRSRAACLRIRGGSQWPAVRWGLQVAFPGTERQGVA